MTQTSLLRHGLSPSTHHINESRSQNRLILACNLPEEVLCKILITCAQISVGVSDPTWSWVNISYVCSNWRRVALASQDLWRYIDFSDPRWYNLTSTRAKMSAAHIIATVADTNIRQLHRTLRLAHRIQDIHLKSSIQDIHPLLEILTHPNPALESMIVDVHIPQNLGYVDTYDPPSFPTTGPPLTNLRYLELHNTPFYILTSRCTFLTSFHLHDLPLTERPTLQYFLFMLEQLTMLQYLTLDRAFPIDIDGDEVRGIVRPINFLHLKYISLVGSVPEVTNTLECITFSPSARLVAKICTLVDLKNHAWRLTETFSAHAWGADVIGMPLETLVLTGRESGPRFRQGFEANPEFRQSLRIRAFRADWEGGGAALDLIIAPEEQDGSSDEGLITALVAMCKALSLMRIHTLALQDVDIVTQKTWTAFLKTLPSLRVLDITGRAPSGLVWALLLNAKSHGQGLKGDGETQRLLVPPLNDIYLHNVDCSSGGFMVAPKQSTPVNSHCDLDDSPFLDVLIASLNHRKKFGLCTRSLSIARCVNVLCSVVGDARAAVKYLICDLRNLMKKEEVDPRFPAQYSSCWDGQDLSGVGFRHYHRLRTLIDFDSEN